MKKCFEGNELRVGSILNKAGKGHSVSNAKHYQNAISWLNANELLTRWVRYRCVINL